MYHETTNRYKVGGSTYLRLISIVNEPHLGSVQRKRASRSGETSWTSKIYTELEREPETDLES